MHARLVLGLAERFGCPPSVVLREPATVLRMLAIEALGRPDDPEPDYG